VSARPAVPGASSGPDGQNGPNGPNGSAGAAPARARLTVGALAQLKATGMPITMVTAYDFPSARVAQDADVDVVLVGDSAAMTVLGHDSTLPVGMTEMLVLAAAVRRGLRTPLLVADLPFGSYERTDEHAIGNAQRFVKEAGADAVKLERGGTSADRARAIVAAGVPVMGHVGLTPQTAGQLGGFRAQGRTAAGATRIAEEALALQEAGCFALVLEAIPAAVTEQLMPYLHIPVIGIGAGPATDGQVLVFHDLLGMSAGTPARFVKRYADLHEQMVRAVGTYADDVRTGKYPGPEHTYGIAAEELRAFADSLATRAD
jgi:3-methyl-2-oxobutanoate hydroxymethyltransferase